MSRIPDLSPGFIQLCIGVMAIASCVIGQYEQAATYACGTLVIAALRPKEPGK